MSQDAPKQDPGFSAELHRLCGQLREHTISKDESARLCEILLASKQARRFYRTYMALTSALETRSTLQDIVDVGGDSEQNIEQLFELMQLEQDAPVIKQAEQPAAVTRETKSLRDESLGLGEIASASGYLLFQAMKTGPGRWVAAAAVFAITATIYFVFHTPQDDSQTPTAKRPAIEQPADDRTPDPFVVVATLTAEHDAKWVRRPGDDLYPGQRFTLTQGFAEITTKRGAVVILEAPATIELLNHENALHLHAGKMVARCETLHSKGFVVETGQAVITDIGTVFGVKAAPGKQARVQVLQGEVRAASRNASGRGGQPVAVFAGQAVNVGPQVGVRPVAYQASLFQSDARRMHLEPKTMKGNVDWLGLVRGDLRLNRRESKQIQLYIERENHRLDEQVVVDLVAGQQLDKVSLPGQQHVSVGSRVDIYLLHADSVGDALTNQEIVIRFDRPVLGVISDEKTLRATDKDLGVPDALYPDLREIAGGQRGLDLNLQDRMSLSRDGKTLRIFSGVKLYLDQVRILVAAKHSDHTDSNSPGSH